MEAEVLAEKKLIKLCYFMYMTLESNIKKGDIHTYTHQFFLMAITKKAYAGYPPDIGLMCLNGLGRTPG